MTSRTTRAFRKALEKLPIHIQRQARESYKLWKEDPQHPGLQFKKVHSTKPIYSVRVAIGWRAVGVRSGDVMIWYWIGSHQAYDKLLSQL